MSPAVSSAPDPRVDAAAVARGVCRLFWRHQLLLLPEVSLRNGRRADLMGIGAKGELVIVEIKCARADLLGDQKWTDYLDYCDRFYWAICPDIDAGLLDREAFLPERTGLIVADAYEAAILRQASSHPLPAARRKVEVQRLARTAMRRLTLLADPDLGAGEPMTD